MEIEAWGCCLFVFCFSFVYYAFVVVDFLIFLNCLSVSFFVSVYVFSCVFLTYVSLSHGYFLFSVICLFFVLFFSLFLGGWGWGGEVAIVSHLCSIS